MTEPSKTGLKTPDEIRKVMHATKGDPMAFGAAIEAESRRRMREEAAARAERLPESAPSYIAAAIRAIP